METQEYKKTLETYLNTINQTYCSFLLYYNLYHEFLLNCTTGEHQKKDDAEKKIEVMNKYVSIFNGFQGLYKLAVIELHKLFDKSNPGNSQPTVSLHLLINYIEENSDNLNIKLDSIFIETCRKKINKISNKLTNLKRSRDNISHNLQKLKTTRLKFSDIDDITKTVDELFNYIDSAIRRNSWNFHFFHEEPKRDMNLLIKDLMNLRELSFLIINNSGKKNSEEMLKEIKGILQFDYF